MKPGYKIIIAGLLVYGGIKVKEIMDVAPYKERASYFVTLLKQSRPFEAQEILDSGLQKVISVEKMVQLIKEQNLSQSSEIQWSGWKGEEGNYTLQGALLFRNAHKVSAEFSLFTPKEADIRITYVKIGSAVLHEEEENSTVFLK